MGVGAADAHGPEDQKFFGSRTANFFEKELLAS
jgi:hypothetical protein